MTCICEGDDVPSKLTRSVHVLVDEEIPLFFLLARGMRRNWRIAVGYGD